MKPLREELRVASEFEDGNRCMQFKSIIQPAMSKSSPKSMSSKSS